MRHYTNNAIKAIEETRVLKASDQNKVFFDKAQGKPLSPRDAEAKFGLKPGRGRNIVETDVPNNRIELVWNKIMKTFEYQVTGDVPLVNPTFTRR